MASTEKVRQFLQDSDSHAHYSSIVECALTYFIHKAKREGNTRFAADLERAKSEYRAEFAQAVAITEHAYADLFTDEELDDLIILHANPALKKARATTVDLFHTILDQFESASA
jgi:broad-specificity NMP kinase